MVTDDERWRLLPPGASRHALRILAARGVRAFWRSPMDFAFALQLFPKGCQCRFRAADKAGDIVPGLVRIAGPVPGLIDWYCHPRCAVIVRLTAPPAPGGQTFCRCGVDPPGPAEFGVGHPPGIATFIIYQVNSPDVLGLRHDGPRSNGWKGVTLASAKATPAFESPHKFSPTSANARHLRMIECELSIWSWRRMLASPPLGKGDGAAPTRANLFLRLRNNMLYAT